MAEHCNPEIKRLVNLDVRLGGTYNGQSLNRYAYCNGNPVSFIDPFGLSRDGDSQWTNRNTLSLILDFIPGVSNVKSAIEACTGRDVITNEDTSRALSLIGVIPGAGYIGKVGKVARHADEVADAGKIVPKFTKINIPIGNNKYGWEHILRRHGSNSNIENVSKFNKGSGHNEIKNLIYEANQSGGAWKIEGTERVLEVDMGRVIGTDPGGNASSVLRIVTNANGNVITAYPIRNH